MNEEDMFGVNDLDGDEVIVDATASEEVKHSTKVAEKKVSTADLVNTVGEVVTTAEDIEVTTAATTPQISKDELTLAQTLIEIKAAKPKERGAKDKGKEIMVESEKPLKKKDQIAFNEEVARKLKDEMKAEMKEDERTARKKDEANIAMKKLDKQAEAEVDNDQREAEMKMYMKIIPDDETEIDAIPLATKPPIIMLQHIDREDLETLWKLSKDKYGNTRPDEGYERVLWGDLKVMFEPDIEIAPPVSLRPHSPSKGLKRPKKTCFMCKSETHLIKDYDFHARKLAQTSCAPRDIHKHNAPMKYSRIPLHKVPTAARTIVSAARINTVKPSAVTIVQHTHTKKVWRPETLVLDHVFRTTSASMTLKRFDFNDALGRSKHYFGLVNLVKGHCSLKVNILSMGFY
nr:hypothetical protein [Tanacetum cinerariifolium]